MKSSCQYEAYVKSANQHKVTIFIKEVKKIGRFKDQPSFTSIIDNPLLDKGGKIKARVENEKKEEENETDENEEDYLEEE